MKIQELNTKSYGTLIFGTVLTMVISGLLGAAIAGSIGMAEALYGTIIGGIIGAAIAAIPSKITDISPEVGAVITFIGATIGTELGIIYAKNQESKNKKLGIDNSDYLKGLSCTTKVGLSHGQDIINCVSYDFSACEKLLHGPAEIITCMGNNSNNGEIIG